MKRLRMTSVVRYFREIIARKVYRDVKLCAIGEGTSEIQQW
jgi:alkylation response protein AidB-like acyl-CoA dehydrogenase